MKKICGEWGAWGFLLLMAGLALLVSCSKADEPFRAQPDSSEDSSSARLSFLLSNPEKINFRSVQTQVLNKYCIDCHDSSDKKGGLDFTSYNSFKTSVDSQVLFPFEPMESSLYTTLTIRDGVLRMPPKPAAQVSKEEAQLIYLWIEQGAFESTQAEAPEPDSLRLQLEKYFQKPEIIDYSVVQKFVFKPGRCLDCHSENGKSSDERAMMFGADLSSYQDLFYLNGISKGHIVAKSIGMKPSLGSSIYEAVALKQSMPPAGFPELNPLRIQLLKLWILNCAIEKYPVPGDDPLLTKIFNKEKMRRCK